MKTTWFSLISPWEQMSFPLPVSRLLLSLFSSSWVIAVFLTWNHSPCQTRTVLFSFPSSFHFSAMCIASQRPPHQLVLSRSLCSDDNRTLASASVIIGCNCTVCLIRRLWGFICMVISQIYESKNLIISVSCSGCGKKDEKNVSSACDHENMVR